MALKSKERKVIKDSNGNVLKEFKGKTIQDRYATAINTEKKFTNMMIEAESQGLVKQTRKQLNNMRSFVGIMQSNPSQDLLHSSDSTHGKMRKLISSGDHHSPLQQQQDSSVRVNEVMQQMQIAERLTKAESDIFGELSGEMHAYMLTLTRPNSHKGKLHDDYKKHRSRVSKLLKALDDGAKRGNGVQLIDGVYLGGFVSHEVTINEKKLANKQTQGLYHPHTHVILLSDGVLDIPATKDVLLTKWRALNSDLSLSKDAFDLRSAYSEKDDTDDISPIKEIIKYSVKPAIWNSLSNVHDQFQVEVFSELYNAIRRKKLKHSHGLLNQAKSFLSLFSDFSNAMSFSMLDEFPDIVTQLTELIFDDKKGLFGGYNAVYQRQLTADEIVYYNASMIEDVLVSNGVVDQIDDFFVKYADDLQSKRQQVYAEVFKGFVFLETGKDLIARFEELAQIEDDKNKGLKAYDIRLLRQSVLDTVDYDNYHNQWFIEPDLTTHNNFMRDERNKYFDLFDKYVAPVKGDKATLENHNTYGDFFQKQGLSSMNNSKRINLEVRCRDVESYLGIALFGDDWDNVKR